jgi:tetratricopeptide (TPR) repeat protein
LNNWKIGDRPRLFTIKGTVPVQDNPRERIGACPQFFVLTNGSQQVTNDRNYAQVKMKRKAKNRKVNRFLFFVGLSLWMVSSLFSFQNEQAHQKIKPEVISLLGKELFATPAEGEDLLRLQKDLEEAEEKLSANPEDPESVILYGRRLAYLWRYHEAIAVYTGGIKNFPDHAMLYRHRGHRYISIRKFDLAVADLSKAAELNNNDFDIWYHLGLAHYLNGDLEKALPAYKSCLLAAEDDDSRIAISNWLYITLRQLGREDEAIGVLNTISEGMEVSENLSYYDLLLFYKGKKAEKDIINIEEASDLELATVGYGIGCWHLYNNDESTARAYFEKILATRYWPAFGFIAAEADLFRMK